MVRYSFTLYFIQTTATFLYCGLAWEDKNWDHVVANRLHPEEFANKINPTIEEKENVISALFAVLMYCVAVLMYDLYSSHALYGIRSGKRAIHKSQYSYRRSHSLIFRVFER